MGYALLGNVPPIVGIYMAFFPVLVYVFLGTSHHISLGKIWTELISNVYLKI
jgi:solute carrier family 26 protein